MEKAIYIASPQCIEAPWLHDHLSDSTLVDRLVGGRAGEGAGGHDEAGAGGEVEEDLFSTRVFASHNICGHFKFFCRF